VHGSIALTSLRNHEGGPRSTRCPDAKRQSATIDPQP
jgi:hypothetical protein